MIKDILKAVPGGARPARYVKPPDCTFAVYFDDVDADGPDGINLIFTHNITVELYEPRLDNATEAAIEAELNARGLRWTKQTQYWISSTQCYQTIYEFSYIEKRRA